VIDPANITNFGRSPSELEEFAIFAVLVAGKTAKTVAARMERVMKYNVKNLSPMRYIYNFGRLFLPDLLQISGIGCYNQKANTLHCLANICIDNPDFLKTCSNRDLEQIKGIGPKTSRFFILHSRANARLAVLDTHILKGLAAHNVPRVPKATPQSSKEYNRLENYFLFLADQQKKTPAELDLIWWRKYSGN
jgi:thermostable 8-oxoguanine DNA glycosylase